MIDGSISMKIPPVDRGIACESNRARNDQVMWSSISIR